MTSRIRETIYRRATVLGHGRFMIECMNAQYIVDFRFHAGRVLAKLVAKGRESEIFEFESLSEFDEKIRDVAEEYDNSMLMDGHVTFSDTAFVTAVKDKNGKLTNLFCILDAKGKQFYEVAQFRAKNLEEAKKFLEEHRESDDRGNIPTCPS